MADEWDDDETSDCDTAPSWREAALALVVLAWAVVTACVEGR